MNEPKIIMTKLDVMRIRKLLAAGFEWPVSVDYNRLKKELDRAEIVDSRDIPPHVVTMNSRVIYTDTDTGTQHEVTLVYPQMADASKGRISILSPMGSALIGLSEGQTIEWPLGKGITRKIQVSRVLQQPEADGHHLL